MVGHRMASPYELVVELTESHTVTPQTKNPPPISTTSRDTYASLTVLLCFLGLSLVL
jgi:hypothetical protein